jgi:hypothetical protein
MDQGGTTEAQLSAGVGAVGFQDALGDGEPLLDRQLVFREQAARGEREQPITSFRRTIPDPI